MRQALVALILTLGAAWAAPAMAAIDGPVRVDGFKPSPLPDKAKADFWRRFYAGQPAN